MNVWLWTAGLLRSAAPATSSLNVEPGGYSPYRDAIEQRAGGLVGIVSTAGARGLAGRPRIAHRREHLAALDVDHDRRAAAYGRRR